MICFLVLWFLKELQMYFKRFGYITDYNIKLQLMINIWKSHVAQPTYI